MPGLGFRAPCQCEDAVAVKAHEARSPCSVRV